MTDPLLPDVSPEDITDEHEHEKQTDECRTYG